MKLIHLKNTRTYTYKSINYIHVLKKTNMSQIFKEYITFFNKVQTDYGNSSIVLMEVGSFYEIYAIQTSDVSMGPPIYELGDLLNIQITKKNKNIEKVCESNHLMAGFPKYCLHKYLNIFLSNNYTIVLVEQVTPPPKSVREITQIFSPSTVIDELNSYESNLMMIIYFEKSLHIQTKHPYLNIGWSVFDASTGKSECNEIVNQLDEKIVLDEIYRLILQYNPRELVYISNTSNQIDSEHILNYLGGNMRCAIHNKLNLMDSMYEKITFQNNILKKVFPDTGMLSVIEYLNLEYKQLALISFTYMIQFVYEHNEFLLGKLQKPFIEYSNDSSLILAYNSIYQLNIVGGDLNILSIFNTCNTSVGKRFFKKRLLNPISDVSTLNKSYHQIDFFIRNDTFEMNKDFVKIIDIERYIRKIDIDKLNPCEFNSLIHSLSIIDDIIHKIHSIPNSENIFSQLQEYVTSNQFTAFIDECNATFQLNELSKYNIDSIKGNIFQANVHVDLDKLHKEHGEIMKYFATISDSVSDKWLKEENNERDGYHFSMTNKRWDILKKKSHPIVSTLTKLSTTGSMIRLSSNEVKERNHRLQEIDKEFQHLSSTYFISFLKTMVEKYKTYFENTIYLLELLDFHIACAKNTIRYGLVQPSIQESEESFIKLTNVRHPIIEKIQKNVEYTPNSISIGGIDEIHNGMILFGVNSSGKSSLMKSIGISVILAQAGMYVPCQKMVYSPYKELFTRIQNTDNIYKGLSTFANEISELRNIFKRSGKHSLVIGDELCSGTESVSAISIVTAGIDTLVRLNSSFLFATHLHELNHLQRIKNLQDESKIAIKHISVYYDEEKKTLIYDRILQDGPGNALYGLEVCKAMDLEPEFIHLASTIRHEIIHTTSDITRNKLSKYNTKVIVDECNICKSKDNIEVHHIRFQKDANQHGLIKDTFHKNTQHNLIPLCEKCHNDVHHDKLCIHGYIQTSKGVQIHYTIK